MVSRGESCTGGAGEKDDNRRSKPGKGSVSQYKCEK